MSVVHACRDCRRTPLDTTFRPDRRTRSGLSPRCTPCRDGTRRPDLPTVITLATLLYPQDRRSLHDYLTVLISEDEQRYPPLRLRNPND